MRTSLAMFGRLSVLAVCLIVIPLIALFGGSLPELARTVLDRYWNGEVIAAEQTLEEAPRFEPTVAIRAPAELSHRAAAPLFRETAVEAGLPRGEQMTPAFSRQADLKAAKSQEAFPVVSSQFPTNKTQANRSVPSSSQAMPIPAGKSDLASGSRFPQEIPFTAQPVSFTEAGKKGSGSIAANPMAPPSSSALVPIAPVSPQEPFPLREKETTLKPTGLAKFSLGFDSSERFTIDWRLGGIGLKVFVSTVKWGLKGNRVWPSSLKRPTRSPCERCSGFWPRSNRGTPKGKVNRV